MDKQGRQHNVAVGALLYNPNAYQVRQIYLGIHFSLCSSSREGPIAIVIDENEIRCLFVIEFEACNFNCNKT